MSEFQNRPPSWSTKLGMITGPLMLILGCIGYYKGQQKTISIFIIFMGLLRIGMTIGLMMKSKKKE
jgi:hypothetical protein